MTDMKTLKHSYNISSQEKSDPDWTAGLVDGHSCLFLSDVHYGNSGPETDLELEKDLTSLTEYCIQHRIHPFLLGDIFDYWMEYPSGKRPAMGNRLLNRFHRYMQQTKPILYITGNHDYWTRGYFKTLGFDIDHEYRELELADRRILLLHGDGLKDPQFHLPRPAFNRLLMHPLFVRLYQSLLPPPAGFALMRWLSRFKRKFGTTDPRRLDTWAKEFLKKSDYDFVISGHDHTPRMETFSFGTYINTGAFYLHRTAVLYTNGQFRHVTWNREHKKLKLTEGLDIKERQEDYHEQFS